MKICTVIGARPQFIKAAVVSRAIREAENFQEIIIHTGQHYDANMSDIFFEELSIPRPDYHLGIGGGLHGENTGRMIEAIEKVLLKEQPNIVLLYGDTDSTLAGALAASKLHIPVAHVEAGLRSFNRSMPEEINRVLTDHISSLLFAPTSSAIENLKSEGIREGVIGTGDVMYDAMLFYADEAAQKSTILNDLGVTPGSFILATLHRAENTQGNRLLEIFAGLAGSDQPVILPVHPRTEKAIMAFGLKIPKNIRIIEAVGYLDMIELEKNACLIATDSGGVQKEAYFNKIPCVTLREETEWTELLEHGANVLVGSNSEKIKSALNNRNDNINYPLIYGDGNAGKNIVAHIRSFLGT